MEKFGLQSGNQSYTNHWYSMTNIDEYLTDVLMRDLVGHDRKPVSFLVYLWLAAEEGRRDGAVQISYQELAESIGVSKSSAQASVKWLIRRKLLAASKENVTATPRYTVLRPWRETKRSGGRAP
ncbi:MAG TPA: hypothetical protein VN875_09865 [Candidatus Binatus sp.]|nr:hypothetical protein [Candidatus Binatus sp.]